MNVMNRTIALLLTTTALVGLTSHSLNPSEPATAAPGLQLSQRPSQPDLQLLARASAEFFQSDRYQTESVMEVKASAGSTNITSTARITTIVQAPNRFRAEIVFSEPGASQERKSIVVSDGKQVWMYRPDLKQYLVTSYQEFDTKDDAFWIGFSSYFFLQIPPESRQPIAAGALTDPAVLKELGLTENSAIRGGVRSLDGRSVYVYSYTDKDGFTIDGVVDPKTATLEQIAASGQSEGFDISIVERLVSRTPAPAIAANTFKFSPPRDATAVEKLEIGPF